MTELSDHAAHLLRYAQRYENHQDGIPVAGVGDRRAVRELVEAGLVRLEAERDEATGFSGRIWVVKSA